MKRGLILALWESFNKIEVGEYDLKFSYFIAKNKVFLKPEITAIDEVKKATKRFSEYETKRIELAKKYCEKDSAKQPIIINDQFKITTHLPEFEVDMTKLKEEYKDEIIKRQNQLDAFIKFLEDDTEITLTTISFDHLPQKIDSEILEIFIEANLIRDFPME